MVNELIRKYNKMPSPLKASIWFVVCGVIKDVVDVIATPIFTRLLTVDQYGYFNVYNSWFQIFKILFTLNLYYDIFSAGLSRFEKDSDSFTSSTLGFVTTLTLFFLVLFLFFPEKITTIIKLPFYLIVLLFIHVLVYVPYNCWIRKESYDYKYKRVVFVSFLYILLQPTIALASIINTKSGIDPGYLRIIASVSVQAIIGLVLYVAMMVKGRVFFSKKYWKYSIKTGLVLLPFSISKVILNQSDRIMINYYYGSGDTAIFSVAHSAAFVLLAVTEAIGSAFVPWVYRKLKDRDNSGIKQAINSTLLFVAICVISIDIIAPEIMRILGNKEYYLGVYCIPSLVYSVFLIYLYSLFTNIKLFFGKNTYVTYISIVGMITNILLNYIFIRKYGFIAAGYTSMVSYLVICLGHYYMLKKCLLYENIKMNELIDSKFVVLTTFSLLIFTLMCNVLYKHLLLRLIIVALILIAIFLKRKRVSALLKTILKETKNG